MRFVVLVYIYQRMYHKEDQICCKNKLFNTTNTKKQKNNLYNGITDFFIMEALLMGGKVCGCADKK